jgi:hypothetical protein
MPDLSLGTILGEIRLENEQLTHKSHEVAQLDPELATDIDEIIEEQRGNIDLAKIMYAN